MINQEVKEVKEVCERISASFNLEPKSFNFFKEALDAAPKTNKGMEDQLNRESSWDNSEEKAI